MEVPDQTLDAFREATSAAERRSYPRYSGFPVYAAVETVGGRVFSGANVECVNLTLTKHAEESAIMNAISNDALSEGDRWLKTLYVVEHRPCGGCRQFAWEFAAENAQLIIDGANETGCEIELLSAALPGAFGPEALEDRRPADLRS